MSVLQSLASTAQQVIDGVGYAGLAAVMLVENVLPPVPSELVLPVVGIQIAAGRLVFWAAVLSSTVGSVLGAWVLYAVGRFGGRPLVLRLPSALGVTPERLDRTQAWFARRGDAIVLIARLVPGLRSAVSVPAGTLRMPVLRFLLFTALGSGVWNAALIWLGTVLAAHWESVVGTVSGATTYVLTAAAGLGMLVLMARKVRTAQVPR
jgi:membrane protein DedA with SNARE-associated domain